MSTFKIEVDQEEDGRWLAEVSKVQALALRVVAERWSTAKLALSRDMSTRLRKPRRRQAVTFVICAENSGYPASSELHKIYRVVLNQDAAREGALRAVDESGEDYLSNVARCCSVGSHSSRMKPRALPTAAATDR